MHMYRQINIYIWPANSRKESRPTAGIYRMRAGYQPAQGSTLWPPNEQPGISGVRISSRDMSANRHARDQTLPPGKSGRSSVVLTQVSRGTNKGVPGSYETTPSQNPAAGLYLGSCGNPRGGGVYYERGIPVSTRQGGRRLSGYLTPEPSALKHHP